MLEDPKATYLDLLKLSLSGLAVAKPTSALGYIKGEVPLAPLEPGFEARRTGSDWPVEGFTMIGLERLGNLQRCVEDVLERDIPGDLIETGVWRGGAAMLMRALLALHRDGRRMVFAADSFEGLPAPDVERYPADAKAGLHEVDFLRVSLQEVEEYFGRFGLLDERVRFVKGWFRDTLPPLAGRTWALIRLDGDLYESTIVALDSLYEGLSPGGYLIVDDYHLAGCRQAVDEFRDANGIREELVRIDWAGVYWQKSG
jgi:O-methyltransferase